MINIKRINFTRYLVQTSSNDNKLTSSTSVRKKSDNRVVQNNIASIAKSFAHTNNSNKYKTNNSKVNSYDMEIKNLLLNNNKISQITSISITTKTNNISKRHENINSTSTSAYSR